MAMESRERADSGNISVALPGEVASSVGQIRAQRIKNTAKKDRDMSHDVKRRRGSMMVRTQSTPNQKKPTANKSSRLSQPNARKLGSTNSSKSSASSMSSRSNRSKGIKKEKNKEAPFPSRPTVNHKKSQFKSAQHDIDEDSDTQTE